MHSSGTRGAEDEDSHTRSNGQCNHEPGGAPSHPTNDTGGPPGETLVALAGLVLGGLWPTCRDAVPVVVAERARGILGQGVAVALPVRGPHEGRDHVEVPLGDVRSLAPEVGEAEVDVELEEVDPGGLLRHWEYGKKRVGRTALRH